MITKDNIQKVLLDLKFFSNHGVYTRHFGSADEGFDLEYNYNTGKFNYPVGLQADRNTTQEDYPTVDGQNPTISLTSDLIHAEPGRTFNITGKISDADGIKSIRLKNEGMLLDKTINLLDIYKDSLLHEYNLDYAYTPADDWTDNSSFPLEVTVEDVVGKVAVTLDGDVGC